MDTKMIYALVLIPLDPYLITRRVTVAVSIVKWSSGQPQIGLVVMRLDTLGFMASEASGSPTGLASAVAADGHRPHHPLSFKLRFCTERQLGRSYVSLVKPLRLREYRESWFGLFMFAVAIFHSRNE